MKINTIIYILIVSSLLACNDESKMDNENNSHSAHEANNINERNYNRTQIGKIPNISLSHTVNATGYITSEVNGTNIVHSKTDGVVTALKFKPGEYVKQGQVVAVIENIGLIELQRRFLEAKSNFDFLDSDRIRKEKLIEERAVSDKDYEKSISEFNVSKAAYSSLKRELEYLGINPENLSNNYEFKTSIYIYASTNGYVSEVFVNRGSRVSKNDPIYSLIDKKRKEVTLNIKVNDISYVSIGDSVIIRSGNVPSEFTAILKRSIPTANQETATVSYIAELIEDYSDLLPGQFVQASIRSKAREMRLLNETAVIREGEKYFAFKANGNEFEKVKLESVQRIGDYYDFSNSKDGEWALEGAYYIEE